MLVCDIMFVCTNHMHVIFMKRAGEYCNNKSDTNKGYQSAKYKCLMYNKMKSFIAKRVNSILVNLVNLRFKLLKY